MAELRREEEGLSADSASETGPEEMQPIAVTTTPQREADALVRVAERSLSGGSLSDGGLSGGSLSYGRPSRPGDRYQVIVHVDANDPLPPPHYGAQRPSRSHPDHEA